MGLEFSQQNTHVYKIQMRVHVCLNVTIFVSAKGIFIPFQQ